jgi:hypothetical protein
MIPAAAFVLALAIMLPQGARGENAGADATPSAGDEIFAAAVEAVRNRDYPRGYILFAELAEADAADAQFNLAVMLRKGQGRPQNYRQALFWAWLSHLGGETRAEPLARTLAQDVPPEIRAEVVNALAQRLEGQLAAGRSDAIIKFARLNAELRDPPDYETAYVWFAIGQALGVGGAAAGLAAAGEELEPAALVAAQDRAEKVFAESAFADAVAN